jgi:hypothetical protein
MNTILDVGGRNEAEPNMETVTAPCKRTKLIVNTLHRIMSSATDLI